MVKMEPLCASNFYQDCQYQTSNLQNEQTLAMVLSTLKLERLQWPS